MRDVVTNLHPANKRWRYFVTTSVIGWAQTYNQHYDTLCSDTAETDMGHDLGLILGLRPANKRWHYFVTTSLIGWAQT